MAVMSGSAAPLTWMNSVCSPCCEGTLTFLPEAAGERHTLNADAEFGQLIVGRAGEDHGHGLHGGWWRRRRRSGRAAAGTAARNHQCRGCGQSERRTAAQPAVIPAPERALEDGTHTGGS